MDDDHNADLVVEPLMAPYFQLPGYQFPRNALLDLSPINDAIDTGIRVKQQGIENQYRERDFGMRERQLKSAEADRAENRDFRQQQFKFQQERAAADDKYRQTTLGLQVDAAKDAREKSFLSAAGGVAQLIAEDQDPARAQAQWQRLMQSDPRWQQWAKTRGLDPNDHVSGSRQMIAEVRGYQNPESGYELKTIKDDETPVRFNKKTGMYSPVPGFENRQPKLSDSDKGRVAEADKAYQDATGAVGMLRDAARLNERAYSGPLAGTRAAAASTLWPGATPGADATILLDNTMKAQALAQLRQTFGGAPTEGERQILLDLQGSVGNNQAVRSELIERAQLAAARRQALARAQAEDMRTGRYFQPDYRPPEIPEDPRVKGAVGRADREYGQNIPRQGANIPPGASADLKSDPSPQAQAEFDALFGRGAAARVLGGR